MKSAPERMKRGSMRSSWRICVNNSRCVSAAGDPMNRELASIPYALRNSYGEAAIPFLEAGVKESEYVWVRVNCARELVLAARPAGFAFIVDAMEGNKFYKREMVEYVRERFPELKGADEGSVLEFVRLRASLKRSGLL